MMKSRNEYYKFIKDEISIKQVCDKLNISTKQVGEDYICSCIFHTDPHPSMHIYNATRSFYCFECCTSGNLYTILEHKLNCDFYGAVKWLEQQFPELLKEKPGVSGKGDKAFGKTGYEIAYEKYQDMTSAEKEKLGKFAQQRGYETQFLIENEIFYAEGKKLYSAYAQDTDQHIEEMEKLKQTRLLTNLPMKSRDIKLHYSDIFRQDRIILTLRDESGKICGFAGRSFNEMDKPKYLFTKGLSKSQILYRLNSVEKKLGRNRQPAELFIVEGMFDALRLETMGKCAVAVLGNRLVDKQIEILGNVIDKSGANVTLSLFFDTDTAGLDGTIASIKKIWKNKVLKKCYLKVHILKDGTKDPDEAFKGQNNTEEVSYSAFEFLMRYYLKEEENLTDLDLQIYYVNLNTEARISLLHKMQDIVPKQEWEELFNYYDTVVETDGQGQISDSVFSYLKIRNFIIGSPLNNEKETCGEKRQPTRNYHYQMQTALEIARTGYERQEIRLDDATWERIALGADAFFDYLYELLEKCETIPIPMLTMQVPKKLGVTRKKSMYCHEELLLQQYVMNELLSRGGHEGYERSIPAVRYEPGAGTYVTGFQYPDLAYETVSFAYQIDMSAISGTVEIKRGMYRPFYECWKAYIAYVQDGIEKLEGDRVYRVKLDIQGFYDNLRNYVIRDAVSQSVEEALKYDEDKFIFFRDESLTNKDTAKKIVEWILMELYKADYYDAMDGSLLQNSQYDCGIPQGPDLSSYAANVALFCVDQKAQSIVREVNEACKGGKIRARYARYVDDMIIVASSPAVLLRIKEAIAAQLYELNLNLSPKTEEADGISKEDAYGWTIEERGGFGVSAGFDMPDDTSASLMEEYEDYEVTDRRDALKLLQSNLNALLYEGSEKDDTEWATFFDVFFQTVEIRYADIVRFSELLIYHAAKQEGDLTEAFGDIWEQGKKRAQDEALFLEDGLEVLAFLDGCRRILLRQKNPSNPDSYHTWEPVENKIKDERKTIYQWFQNSVSGKDILEANRWIISLKLIEFNELASGPSSEITLPDARNEYCFRFLWINAESSAGFIEYMPDAVTDITVLQMFHFILEALRRIEAVVDFANLQSVIKNYLTYKNVGDDILLECIKNWTEDFSGNTEGTERALRVLLNIIPSDFKAEIINRLESLKKRLFSTSGTDDVCEYLPVFPGIKYPGIFEIIKDKKSFVIKRIERVDLVQETARVANPNRWQSAEKSTITQNIFVRNIDDSGKRFINLSDYCEKQEVNNAQKALQMIADIYPLLQDALARAFAEAQKDPDNRRVVLSARNVVLESNEDGISGIDLENAYLISSLFIPNVVAVEQAKERYELQVVYENGASYWTAGYLLKDACKVEAIKFKALSQGNKEIRDAEMLKFSMRRLYGHMFQINGAHYRGEKSYQNSVKRTITLIKAYLESADRNKKYFLEDARIINSFIEEKLNNEYGEFPDQGLGNAVWAKNYLRFGFCSLKQLFFDQRDSKISEWQITRRVPKWYCCLAEKVDQLYEENIELNGLKALAAGLYADAVLLLLRMQALECIRVLNEEQRITFLKDTKYMPYTELGLGGKELLITQGDITAVYQNFLLGKEEEGVKKITHLGWLVILAKVYEIDKEANFIVVNEQAAVNRKKIRENLKKAAEHMIVTQKIAEQHSLDFPFEKMSGFFGIWNKENVCKILQFLQEANRDYGVEVRKTSSPAYRQRRIGKRIRIDTGREIYEGQKYFLTFGKADSGIKEVESDIMEPSAFIYTQTSVRGKVAGISALASEFGELLQLWEQSGSRPDLQEPENEVNGRPQTLEQEMRIPEIKELIIHEKDLRKASWERRGNIKIFQNADRIALFQFRIDSSYRHPSVEMCTLKKEENEKAHLLYNSCAEFRRRKILEPVLQACANFGVQILLLPEYSIRPETIQWMCELIKEKSDYNFSVWAGTFRIPPGYMFDGNKTIRDSVMNDPMYWHSAPLPIILNTGKNTAEIVIKKYKKFPAVALKEDINPAPAYEVFGSFSPVMHKYVEERPEEQGNKMPHFYDARDDVMELICAEFFAVASISNYPSFLKESLLAYSDYRKQDLVSDKEAYENYEIKYFKNLKEFGKFTALYQRGKRYIRTPILLVPACATRAVDYYVFGQGFYLSAGLKTVFCNAVDTGVHGGSCFIGPDSWDDRKIKTDDYYLMENTIYHGLKPGIFMQTSPMKNRGALGDEEQALLICDIYPEHDKRNPNAESMLSAFSPVAHIPVFEERNYTACCKKHSKCAYCSKYNEEKAEKRRKEAITAFDIINQYINKYRNNTFLYEGDLEEIHTVAGKLKYLGETYKSEWFVRRAEYFERFYKMYPQAWPPPALTDWIYVEIDYDEFLREGQTQYEIQIPPRNKKKEE